LSAQARLLVLGFLAAVVIAMWVFAAISKHFERVASGVAALPPAEFERFTLLTLGSGGSFENHLRRGPALAVGLGQDLVLVDAGRGVGEALRAAAIPVGQARLLLLTSLAAENVLGLDELWLGGWLRGRETPLVIHGPPGTQAFAEGLARTFAAQADAQAAAWSLPEAGRRIEAHEPAPGASVAAGGLLARAQPLAGGPLPALAWRVEGAGRSVAVALGSAAPDALVEAARGADFWVSEAVYGAALERAREAGADGIETLLREAEAHPRLEALGALASRAGVASVVLVRLRPPPPFASQYEDVLEEAGFRGRVHVAADGDRFTP
jgi:ribonuclease Z